MAAFALAAALILAFNGSDVWPWFLPAAVLLD